MINWNYLSLNPNAIELLKENKDKINWNNLSSNPNAIGLLKEYNYQKSLNQIIKDNIDNFNLYIIKIIFLMIVIYEINNFDTYKNLIANISYIKDLYDIIIIIYNNGSLLNFNFIKLFIEFIVNLL